MNEHLNQVSIDEPELKFDSSFQVDATFFILRSRVLLPPYASRPMFQPKMTIICVISQCQNQYTVVALVLLTHILIPAKSVPSHLRCYLPPLKGTEY